MGPEDEIWEPEPGAEFSVEVDDICTLFGGCDKCPGHITATVNGEVSTIFCTHWCHKAVETV